MPISIPNINRQILDKISSKIEMATEPQKVLERQVEEAIANGRVIASGKMPLNKMLYLYNY